MRDDNAVDSGIRSEWTLIGKNSRRSTLGTAENTMKNLSMLDSEI